MKRLTILFGIALMLLSFIPIKMSAVSEAFTTSVPENKPAESTEAQVLITRLGEIKAIDKSELSASEKKVLRKEVRGIKKELKEMRSGIYISVGAAILIVVLLILLL